jgi:sigma-B regulation protein RsbU (phosphoserine phosphatase)
MTAGHTHDVARLFEEAPCGLLVTSEDGTIVRANATFCRWAGVTEPDLAGRRRLQDMFTMGARIFHQTHWAPLLRMQGSVAEIKVDIVHADGTRIPLLMNAVRRSHDSGVQHEVAVFIAKDRAKYESELLRARQQAEDSLASERAAQASLALAQTHLRKAAEDRAHFAEQMVGIVSHDLRNPLSTIMVATEALLLGQTDARQLKLLQFIMRASERSTRLIADLLDFTLARVGQGVHVAPRPIDLHDVISHAVSELELAFPGRRLTYRHEGDRACIADPDRMTQLLGNLVANAMAYGSADTPVEVMTSGDAQAFRLAVRNQGRPIADTVLATMFEPMTRGHDVPESARSVGLGLFIVRGIAAAHGGQVDVTSSAAGVTTFTATFPRTLV